MESIEQLKREMVTTQGTGEQAIARFKLLRHPDATWADIIELPDSPVLIPEQASMTLHEKLKVPTEGGLVMSKAEWYRRLAEAGIDKTEKVSAGRE